ncbi:NapA-type sodium/hydrogen antiporter [Thermococcus kodakarensis KOD1]|uniref:NapA-type sodium/hydrogen antiporter n=1 Tax=Thermococcus kodakarensis (strain ATCC BAA-918 / JCM 12380 / KOD1) TaxID=69014 RepID=Q5JF84_THEKO|nr:cation:proton antiporter [Thermococcus kodakarensis]WCN28672.1 cation:proton antiporter [Thermococcus kodakarensis]WCN30970.1 cation:proton antiporter [Thermococcus kodakarensis]BAD84816.1 NapA-type sodium/hydrogen antiporter [Thermococcus kodakarensis KOD1]
MAFDVIGYVFIIIAVARIFAEVFERIGYPGFLGEITAGLMLGVFLHDLPREDLTLMAEFGVFFLMMYAGLELTPEEVRIGGKKSLPIYVITLVVMFFLTLPFTGYRIGTDNFIVASILAVASAPIVIRLTRFFGQEFLHIALSYAVISEVGTLVILYILINFELHHLSYFELFLELLKDAVFLTIVLGLNYVIGIKQRLRIIRALRRLQSDEAVFGMVMILATSLALISEELGLHFSIGAFLVGLMLHSDLLGTKQYERVHTIISGVTYGIFAPIFFAWRGINFETEFSLEVVYFFLVIYLVRILLTTVLVWEKDLKVSLTRAAGISSFGVLGLLVGEVGYSYGVLSEHMYALASLASVLGIFVSASIGLILSKLSSSG